MKGIYDKGISLKEILAVRDANRKLKVTMTPIDILAKNLYKKLKEAKTEEEKKELRQKILRHFDQKKKPKPIEIKYNQLNICQ